MTEHSLEQFTGSKLGSEITAEQILEDFEFLDDWEDRYAYIIDLGKHLPAFPEAEKNEENLVRGCQSQVWLIEKLDPASQKIWLMIDSDALIVKGLAAIVMACFNGKPASNINEIDIEAVFGKMDLIRHISPTRGNGLRAMVDRIRKLAQDIAKG